MDIESLPVLPELGVELPEQRSTSHHHQIRLCDKLRIFTLDLLVAIKFNSMSIVVAASAGQGAGNRGVGTGSSSHYVPWWEFRFCGSFF